MFARQPLLQAVKAQTRGRRPPPAFRAPPIGISSPIASSSSAPASSPLTESETVGPDTSEVEVTSGGWYFVNRSDGGQLPVYSKIRNGGSVTTIVRKVDTLQNDLSAYLKTLHIDPFTAPPKVTVRPTNQHVQIKGHWVDEVKGWLEGRGF
ncbi:hypothetical protein IAU60_002691 [Kwoniella sp. DSM 27419]